MMGDFEQNDISDWILSIILLLFAPIIGLALRLLIELRLAENIRIPLSMAVWDSFVLGLILAATLYLSRSLAAKFTNIAFILLLSFGLMLGGGILTALVFFILSPVSFLYWESGSITFLSINLLFFLALNVIISGFSAYQSTLWEKETSLAKERHLKTQMELKLLVSKINPHFLFNSLNLMISLLKTPAKAETALVDLAEIMRYRLETSDDNRIDLKLELKMVERYLSIQKLRFGEKLTYCIDARADGDIAPFILQPLVENCVVHNIDRVDRLKIDLKVWQDKNKLILSLRDSNAGIHPGMLNMGVGLTVTKKRVEHLGGKFEIKNGGIEISI